MPRFLRADPVAGALLIASALLAVWTPSGRTSPFAWHQTSFRARTDAVIVDVTVRQGVASVTDLLPSEFRVLDDGVPQVVAFAPGRDVPLDLWILTDTSATYAGASSKARFPEQVRTGLRLLRPSDRVAIYSLANPLHVIVPMSLAEDVKLPPMPLTGHPRVSDGVADALVMPGEPGRRHVVMIQWPEFDFVGQTNSERLEALASRSDAQIDLVYSNQARSSPLLKAVLEHAALSSGGGIFKAKDFGDAVRQILASLDHAYVLTYTATGVPRQGWHTITVAVTRPGTFTIGARRGYFVE